MRGAGHPRVLGPATQSDSTGTTTFGYDANNRLTSAGGINYTYDANGNLTSTTAGQSFAWDVFNRMTSSSGPGGTATNTYNGDGLKIRRIGPDGTTRYYYDGIRPIWEGDGAGSMKAQLDRDIFGNLLSRKEPAGTRRYYHFDGLGSTTALSDEGGAAVATLLYDAWGNQRAATGAPVPNYRFTGAELDTASGLYHMGARFYDPTIGRWLSEDPAQDKFFRPETLNFYTYANNGPVDYVDVDGEDPIPACGPPCLRFLEFLQRVAIRIGPWLQRIGQRILLTIMERGAQAAAAEAVRRAANRPGTLDHIFGKVQHGWQALGISVSRGLQLIEDAIYNGILRAGGVEAIEQGRHTFIEYHSDVRLVVIGNWIGNVFRVTTAYWQRWVPGSGWVAACPAQPPCP